MYINANELNGVLSQVATIANMDKSQPGILMDIKDNTVDVYYNTSNKAIIRTIDAVIEDDDIKGKVVFDYKKMIETIGVCKSSGKIKVDNVRIKLEKNPDNSGTATVYVVKTIDEDHNGETVSTVVANNEYKLGWWGVENLSIKQKVLNMPVCEDMFSEANAEQWSIDEFCRVMSEACSGDSKIVYMSPKYNGAFAVNTNSTVRVTANCTVNKVIQLQTNAAKAITSVLNSLDAEDVMINTINSEDGKLFACIFFTPDHKTSIYMGAAAMAQSHLVTMSRYAGFKYGTYQANLMTELVKDTLKSVVQLNAASNGSIKFVNDEEGKVVAMIKAENTGSSTANTYKMKCHTFNTLVEKPADSDEWVELNIDFKLLYDIINLNKCGYTGFDIDVSEAGMCLRISFLDLDYARIKRDEYKKEHEISGPLTMENKIDLRDMYLNTSYYVTVKNN